MIEGEQPEAPPSKVAMGFGVLSILGTAVLAGLVLYRIYPGEIAPKKNPGFIDVIFDTPLVVFASRILLFSIALVLAFAGAFTILSIISWTRHRQWLTKAGPFEVSRDAVEALREQVEFWQQTALAQNEEIQEVRNQLQQTQELLDIFMEPDDPEEVEREGEA